MFWNDQHILSGYICLLNLIKLLLMLYVPQRREDLMVFLSLPSKLLLFFFSDLLFRGLGVEVGTEKNK